MNQSKQRPWCPFCGQLVAPAGDPPQRKMNEFPIGHCVCGAVYCCDVSGCNIGAAMVETLVYACGDNWDLAWDLLPEDDYLTGIVEHYDALTHQVAESGMLDGRVIRGVLFFVRLHRDISEIASFLAQKKKAVECDSRAAFRKQEKDNLVPAVSLDKGGTPDRANKSKVRVLADAQDIKSLVALCLDDKKTLRLLQRRLYDPSEAKRWQSAWLLGKICSRVADRDPGQVSELLHRMFEACSDSAAAPWGMIETIGFVVAQRPDIFGAFAKHLFNYVHDDSTRVQTLWALAYIGQNRPDLVREAPFYSLIPFLEHENGAVRGMMVRLLGAIRATETVSQLEKRRDDAAEFTIWDTGVACVTSVMSQAHYALQQIREKMFHDDCSAV